MAENIRSFKEEFLRNLMEKQNVFRQIVGVRTYTKLFKSLKTVLYLNPVLW